MGFLFPGMRGLIKKAPPIPNQYSMLFDGTDDYGDTGHDFGSILNGTFSLSVWLKYNNRSGTQMIFAADSQQGGDKNRIMIYRAVGETRLQYTTEGAATSICNWVHDPGDAWVNYLFVVRQNGSAVEQEIYANGVLRASNSTASVTMSNYGGTTQKAKVYVGARNQGDASNTPEFSFNGYIDELMVVGSDLAASAADIYAEGSVIGLGGYSPFAWYRGGDNDGGTGTTITDQGSGSNDLTLTSGASIAGVVV